MGRPKIALAMIVKNEAHNLGPLLESVSGCFDQIHITDTGSTDGTQDIIKNKAAAIAGCEVFLHHFEWVKDFAKARQYSFDQVPKEMDYIMWMDGDDLLVNKDAFLQFRNHSMHCAQFWLANYNYAQDEKGRPVCTFMRERVVKNNYGYKWKYFVHEGLVQSDGRKAHVQDIHTWEIKHVRSEHDKQVDKARNLEIFEHHLKKDGDLEIRMKYYYGKEVFESGDMLKAHKWLLEAVQSKFLDQHDRVMAVQYIAHCAYTAKKYEEAIHMGMLGIELDPTRSEYWLIIADSYLMLGQPQSAILFYEGARRGAAKAVHGFTYTNPLSRTLFPTQQLFSIYCNGGDYEKAKKEWDHLYHLNQPLADSVKPQLDNLKKISFLPAESDLRACEDVIITCPPGSITSNWDEISLQTKGEGGSETACIEVARQIHLKTGRPVKIFQPRSTADVMPSGVAYYPISELAGYLAQYKPHVHIAWRHAIRLTTAPSYVWSHDLVTNGGQAVDQYDKYLCLTPFHKEFVKSIQGVPDDKILLVQNGVDPSLFNGDVDPVRNPYKVIFSSSPDRGLERCIEICRIARKKIPQLELHIFYGTANMRKSGLVAEADRLDELLKEDFVTYHGFVSKKDLVRHFRESAVWLYPADFIETSCISAMEAICAGCYPLVRDMGALGDTLNAAKKAGMCTILEKDASCPEEWEFWADKLVELINQKAFGVVNVDPHDYSWEKASEGFISQLGL